MPDTIQKHFLIMFAGHVAAKGEILDDAGDAHVRVRWHQVGHIPVAVAVTVVRLDHLDDADWFSSAEDWNAASEPRLRSA